MSLISFLVRLTDVLPLSLLHHCSFWCVAGSLWGHPHHPINVSSMPLFFWDSVSLGCLRPVSAFVFHVHFFSSLPQGNGVSISWTLPWSRYSSLFPSHPTPPFDRPKLARHQLSHNDFIFPVYLCGYILYVSPLLSVAVTDYLSVYTYTNTPLLPLLLSLNSVLLLSSLLSPLLHKYTITPSIVKFPLFSSPCSR